MRLYTRQEYANRKLHLPVVGNVQLDGQASFGCDDNEARQVIEATKGSLEFHADPRSANAKPINKVLSSRDIVEGQLVKLKEAAKSLADFGGDTRDIDEVISQLSGKKYETALNKLEVKQSESPSISLQEPTAILAKVKEDVLVPEKPKRGRPKKEETKPETEEPIVNVDDVREGIESCESIDDLKTLVELIPGVKVEDMDGLDLDQVKKFLNKKIDEKLAKQ